MSDKKELATEKSEEEHSRPGESASTKLRKWGKRGAFRITGQSGLAWRGRVRGAGAPTRRQLTAKVRELKSALI